MTIGMGVLVLIIYASLMLGVALKTRRQAISSTAEFLLAGRRSGTIQSALSIAATWVWAPALFVSAQKAFTMGITGWLWFFIPNLLTLMVFGIFSYKLYHKFPRGYTLPQYMMQTYSERVHKVYIAQFGVLQVCSFAVQLLAGGAVAALLTGITYGFVVLVLAGVALSYSLISGFKASLITDNIQMVLMIGIGLVAAILTIGAFGWETIGAGLGGLSGKFGNPFSADGVYVMVSFGIVTAVGLFAGPFGDQTFWQRVFAQPLRQVPRSFTIGALLFALIPITFGILGFAGAGAGMQVADSQMINIEVIQSLGHPIVTVLIFAALLAGLGSTMDSNLVAFASIFAADIRKGGVDKVRISETRWAMLGLAIAGVILALIPGIKIVYLFLFYGTLRATTLFPTGMTILRRRSESGMFWGIVIGLVVGAPLFVVGAFAGLWYVSLAGNLIAVGVPALVVKFSKA